MVSCPPDFVENLSALVAAPSLSVLTTDTEEPEELSAFTISAGRSVEPSKVSVPLGMISASLGVTMVIPARSKLAPAAMVLWDAVLSSA